jgi:ribonuclease HI
MVFIYSVWEVRLEQKIKASNTISSINYKLIKTLRSVGRTTRVDENPLLVPGSGPYMLAKCNEDNACSKTRKKGIKKALSLITKFSGERVIYTDGSANPNPGPSGSGVWFDGPAGPYPSQVSFPCGRGNNNTAEVHAIGIAAIALLKLPPTVPKIKLLILSDSKFAINIALGNHRPRKAKGLSRAVMSAFLSLKKLHDVTLEWVPGHEGVLGNEVADKLAGQATLENDSNTLDIVDSYSRFYGHFADS